MGENDEARWDIPGEGTERATCRKCGGMFLRPPKSKRTLCPECFSAQVNAGMKASHAARRAKREARKAEAAANGRQDKTRNRKKEKEPDTMENGADTVQQAWDALATDATEANSEASPAPERAPEEWSKDELRDRLAVGLKKDAGDVVLALYECIRDVARTAGMQPRIVLETMYEIDCTIRQIGGV